MDRWISVKALLIGLLVDVLGTTIGGGAAAIAATIGLSLLGAQQALQDEAFLASSVLLAIETAFGLAFTVLGAFVTAAIAQVEKIRHALGMGFLSVLTSLTLIAFQPRHEPSWTYGISCLLVLPAALLGGYLGTALGKTKGLFERVLLMTAILALLWAVGLGLTAVSIAGG